ncbi:MAG TPA: agmatine deiminase family protein [bacterium]|nr:agmatine deiminase family protein [bacterium]
MPAEWHPHEATWLAWPKHAEAWPGKHLARVEEIFLQILEALLPNEKVHLLVQDEAVGQKVSGRLRKMGIGIKNLLTHSVMTADIWIRDYGPTFIVTPDGRKAWCKWIFNAWGKKYEKLMKDDEIFSPDAKKAASLIPFPCFPAKMVLEGGAIEVNGTGICLVTEQCLLNPNRNAALTRPVIEDYLKYFLGVSEILWLGRGIEGDDTDGHIDDIARFVSPDTLVMAFEDNPFDENHGILKANWQRLESEENRKGKKFNLIKLPMPKPVEEGGVRLPASYANFYLANEVVVLPVFKDSCDEKAVKIMKEVFPRREIIPIDCRNLIYGKGAIHCVTQQEPAISVLG